jgi:hypothetical protein
MVVAPPGGLVFEGEVEQGAQYVEMNALVAFPLPVLHLLRSHVCYLYVATETI